MSEQVVMPAPNAAAAAGWYGKLPGLGDFAMRRLPPEFVSHWDAWLQSGLHAMNDSPAHGSSAAELPATIKGRDSHRGLALAKLRALLLA